MHGDVPLFGMTSDAGQENADVANVADTIYGFTQSRKAGPKFYVFRSVLCSPSFIDKIVTIIQDKDPNIEIVDPYTFMALVKEAKK